jgi:hypothetical protein
MAEFAVAIQSIKELPNIEKPWLAYSNLNPVEADMQKLFFDEWEQVFSEKAVPKRVYFGSEFCQFRLMTVATVKKALEYCWENGYEFTFATPYVHEAKFQQLTEILSFLNETAIETGRTIEVCVSDWGVYHIVQKNYPHLEIAIGRLLNKNIRDPRIANYYNSEKAPEKGKQFFKQSGILSEWFTTFLKNGEVTSVEFDELIQGSEFQAETDDFSYSFHFPFGVTASGSACMVGFMDTEKKDKFRGDTHCKQQCQHYVFELKHRNIPEISTGIYQKGNTAFYSHNRAMIGRSLRQIKDMGNARIVYSLRIPV